MSYRNDHDAAVNLAQALEHELDVVRDKASRDEARIAALEQELATLRNAAGAGATARPAPEPRPAPPPRPAPTPRRRPPPPLVVGRPAHAVEVDAEPRRPTWVLVLLIVGAAICAGFLRCSRTAAGGAARTEASCTSADGGDGCEDARGDLAPR